MIGKLLLLALGVIVAMVGFTGCTGIDRFTDTQAKEIIEVGRPLLEKFYAGLPANSVEVKSYAMADAAEEGSLIFAGRFPANVVTSKFFADGREYTAVVDIETGEIYSDYYMFDINKYIKRQLEPYCKKYGFDAEFNVNGANIWYTIHSHDVAINENENKKTNSYVELDGMIPVSFSQSDLDERAGALLKNAPVTDFAITYDIKENEFFDPRILSDYLNETGNHFTDNSRGRGLNDYKIVGKRMAKTFPETGIESWETVMTYVDDYKSLNYFMKRLDCHKENEFCFVYTGALKSGKMIEYEKDEFVEFDFPIRLEDGLITYHGDEPEMYITLRFDSEPEYEFTRTCYVGEEEKAPEKLIAVKNDDDMWYLTEKDNPKAYAVSYKFDMDQELTFDKK